MNKTELIAKVAEISGEPKTVVSKVLEGVLASIGETLKDGNVVSLNGFGEFGSAKRKARKGRNPRTGQIIEIPATVVPRFKPSQALKNVVKK